MATQEATAVLWWSMSGYSAGVVLLRGGGAEGWTGGWRCSGVVAPTVGSAEEMAMGMAVLNGGVGERLRWWHAEWLWFCGSRGTAVEAARRVAVVL